MAAVREASGAQVRGVGCVGCGCVGWGVWGEWGGVCGSGMWTSGVVLWLMLPMACPLPTHPRLSLPCSRTTVEVSFLTFLHRRRLAPQTSPQGDIMNNFFNAAPKLVRQEWACCCDSKRGVR